jgi:hypothetical protein
MEVGYVGPSGLEWARNATQACASLKPGLSYTGPLGLGKGYFTALMG